MGMPKISADYGDGFANGILIRGMPLQTCHPGEIFWVDSSDATGRKGRGTFRAPDTTFETAMARCTAGRGDIIIGKPGHDETISAAGDLTCDIADVAIVGLGQGTNKATISFDTADTADVDVTASNFSFVNLRISCEFDDVDGAFDVSAVPGVGFYNNFFTCGSALGFENAITLAAGISQFYFDGNIADLMFDDDGESLVFTEGTAWNLFFTNNTIAGAFSTSALDLDDDTLTGTVLFQNNTIINKTAAADYCVEIAAATVGLFINERYGCAGAAVPVTDISASYFVDCHGVDAVAANSIVFPKTATAWP